MNCSTIMDVNAPNPNTHVAPCMFICVKNKLNRATALTPLQFFVPLRSQTALAQFRCGRSHDMHELGLALLTGFGLLTKPPLLIFPHNSLS